ncbi:hypothetical protein Lser_V15G33808 [Lactuca serriola]
MDRVPSYESNSGGPNRDADIVATGHQKRRRTRSLQHVAPVAILSPQIPMPLKGLPLLPHHRISEQVTTHNHPQSPSRQFSDDLPPQELLHSIFQLLLR